MTTIWSTKIRQLKDLGMNYAEIGTACGAPPSTIGSLATGAAKSPRGDLAIRLHDLHASKTSKPKRKAA